MEILKESCIWLSKDLEVLTNLTLTISLLSFQDPSQLISLPISNIIGCKICPESSRTFDLLFFSFSSYTFKTFQFTSTTYHQAQSWCESIEKAVYKAKTRNICFIINPKSGNCSGQRIFDKEILPILSYSPATYDCFLSTSSSYIDELIHRRDFSVYSDIVCLGGDGTIQQVLNAINKNCPQLLKSIRFGVIPVGSRNALACELNGKKMTVNIFRVVKGDSILADLLQVTVNNNRILATCAVSWGIISDASDEAQHLRAFGPLRYNIVALKKFFTKWKQYSGVISFEDSLGQMISFTSDYVFAVVGNHQIPNLHNSEIVLPNARINDGKLDLMLMFFTSKCKTLNMFRKMLDKGSHAGLTNVNFVKSRKVRIEPSSLKVFNVDGEIHYADMIEVEVLPAAIHFIGDPEY